MSTATNALPTGAVTTSATSNVATRAGIAAGGAALALLLLAGGGKARAIQAAEIPRAAAAGIGAGSFTWIGPGNVGGRVTSLAIDPSNPSKIFAATAAGLWRSLDGGASWAPVTTFGDGAVTVVTAVVIDPMTPSVLYAGPSFPFGVSKSVDGGATWMGLPATAGSGASAASGLVISRNGSTLLAWSQDVWRSIDGGATWTATLSFPPSRTPPFVADVAFVNGGPGAVALVSSEPPRYSTDGGASWRVSSGIPHASWPATVAADGAPGIVYVVVRSDDAIHFNAIYRSNDGGVTYARTGEIPDTAFGLSLWTDPANGDHILLGLADLWESFDAGATFIKVSDGTLAPASPGFGITAIVPDPAFDGKINRRVYFATNAGIKKADDISAIGASGATGYTSLNHGLNITGVLSAAGSAVSGIVVASTDTTGTIRLHAGASTEGWTPLGSDAYPPPTSHKIRFDPSDANMFYEWRGRGLYRNSTAGDQASEPIDGSYWNGSTYDCKQPPYIVDCGSAGGNFDSVIVDPNNTHTILVVGEGGVLWRTTNANAPLTATTGPVWQRVSAPFYVQSVAIARSNSAVMWAGGYVNGAWRIARTTNGLTDRPDWTDVTPPLAFYGDPITIALDPVAPAAALILFGNDTDIASTTLWRTTDGGTTWTALPASGLGFPRFTHITALVTHPTVSGWLYAGTSYGLYASADNGETWHAAPDGPVNVVVTDLSWMGRNLVVSTGGRGAFVSARPLDRSKITIDGPASGTHTPGSFTVQGWAISESALSGTGIDTIHVYAVPANGPAIFLGVPAYGAARPDVGAVYGSQFINSGFALTTPVALTPGNYTIAAYAHNAMSGSFDAAASTAIQVQPTVSQPFVDLDTPREGYVTTSAFEVGGWALDAGSPTGTGVDAVQFYVFPNDGLAPGVFMGTGSYGLSRPDVGALFGSRFTNTGFHFSITGLGPGAYVLSVNARSTVTGGFTVIKQIHFTVNSLQLMAISPPVAEAAISGNIFDVDGWAIDKSVENTASPGTGVDTLHVYAYPNPGSGAPPIFLGVAAYGLSRPDVASIYGGGGPRYVPSGFHLSVDRSAFGLMNGTYSIVVFSHSTVTGTFNNLAVVRVTLQ